MTAIEIARRMAELGAGEEGVKAYMLALQENSGKNPAVEMECALYILQNGGDYQVTYSCLVDLYRRGEFQEDCLSILLQAFYAPNEEDLRERYRQNCALLEKYPYFFEEAFPAFEDLPLCFIPYDDKYMIFDRTAGQLGELKEIRKQVVSRNFFRDLEKPILAEDVYSQYELEYLCDNVRPSEWVARENHIYLHYTSRGELFSWLQVLDLRPLLKKKKVVFLLEEEISQYPIDFKARFGVDYSRCKVRPFGIREIERLIWHTQLSTHNGGDFFNEIFDAHPNLLAMSSLMFDSVETTVSSMEEKLQAASSAREAAEKVKSVGGARARELYNLRDRTAKDILVALFLRWAEQTEEKCGVYLDHESRIAPALFFQPHFHDIFYTVKTDDRGRAVLHSEAYEKIRTSPMFQAFKYIKTFTPLRRFTTSYGAAVQYMVSLHRFYPSDREKIIPDAVSNRVLNRSFMIDWQDRLYMDSVLVRFEDGKLNPKATFTALAAFLDLPYTESMTYCSFQGEINPGPEGEMFSKGFSTTAVYRTYDNVAGDAERAYIEYFMRDAYAFYGYDFHYYDGAPMDEAGVRRLMENFSKLDGFMGEAWAHSTEIEKKRAQTGEETVTLKDIAMSTEKYLQKVQANRMEITKILMRDLRFINQRGQPLRMMPLLQLDPALLEQPLYH